MAQSEASSDYPVQLSVDYQGSRNRLSVLLRIILAIPILVVGAFIGGYFDTGSPELNEALLPISAGGFLFIGPLLMIVFRKKYPSVVVRLEPGVEPVYGKNRVVPAGAPGRVSVHGRRAVGASADRVSERRD